MVMPWHLGEIFSPTTLQLTTSQRKCNPESAHHNEDREIAQGHMTFETCHEVPLRIV